MDTNSGDNSDAFWVKVEESLNDIRDLINQFLEKKINVNQFQTKARDFINDDDIKGIPYFVKMLEEKESEYFKIKKIFPMIHLIICAVDVARYNDKIKATDNLSIHPSSNVIGGKGGDFLLECVSDTLANVVKDLDDDFAAYCDKVECRSV